MSECRCVRTFGDIPAPAGRQPLSNPSASILRARAMQHPRWAGAVTRDAYPAVGQSGAEGPSNLRSAMMSLWSYP